MEQKLSPAEEFPASAAKAENATLSGADDMASSAACEKAETAQPGAVPLHSHRTGAVPPEKLPPKEVQSEKPRTEKQPKEVQSEKQRIEKQPKEVQSEKQRTEKQPKEVQSEKNRTETSQPEEAESRRLNAKTVAKIAMFAALCTVLYFVPKISIPGLPPFLELNLSDIPMLIGGFALGPAAGAIIVFCKILFKLPFTSTCCVGELADLLIGLAYVVPVSFIYKKRRSFLGAVLGLAVGTLCSIACGMLTNRLILIPFYVKFMGMSMESLVNICKMLSPNLTVANFYRYYIFGGVLPFNLLRCVLSSVVTVLLYKRISKLLKMF